MKKIWKLMIALGPGIFCLGYTIGTGSVTSMIKAGSQYGMQLLWVLILSAIFAGVLMEAYGRYALVTGETAISGFKKNLWKGKTWAILVIVGVVAGQWAALSGIIGLVSNAIYEVAHLFIPSITSNNYWTILVIAIFLLLLMYILLLRGSYSFFEKLLIIFVSIMALSFIITLFVVLPETSDVVKGLLPTIPIGSELMVAAFVGTTMAAPTFIIRPLILKEKGWGRNHLKEQTRDAVFAAFLMFVISASIMAAATGALFYSGLSVVNVLDMVSALEPAAGKFAVALFMIGTMSAGLSSVFPIMMVLPLLIGDYKKGAMDITSSTFKILTGVAAVIGLIVPILGANPIMAQIATQVASVFVLPLVILGILILINRKVLMGDQRAGLLLNIGLVSAFIFSLVISYKGVLGLQTFF
ncbi:MAG: Nramp family divalent metal transporter [Flavobacteriaceae bacterium]